jgi:hypothetical protein
MSVRKFPTARIRRGRSPTVIAASFLVFGASARNARCGSI